MSDRRPSNPDEPPCETSAAQLSDQDQTSSDSDQTNADVDQSASDAEQSAARREQLASDRDQRASDIDQEASDEELRARGRSATAARTRRTRQETRYERELATQVRSETSRIRDATAARRDHDATARDAAASARDHLAVVLDAEIEHLETNRKRDGGDGYAMEILLQAAHDRRRATAARIRAAAHREQAAADRDRAREDRQAAAADRQAAAEELAVEGVDQLTQTMRRRVGLSAMQRELDRALRTDLPVVVAFVDVVELKAVNDARGHAAGDAVLACVAKCMSDALRPYDVILRYGGDEFVCLLIGQDLAGVRQRFDAISVQVAQSCDGGTGISVGLVERTSQTAPAALIAAADNAMIEARKRA